jgi:hypothetical protein
VAAMLHFYDAPCGSRRSAIPIAARENGLRRRPTPPTARTFVIVSCHGTSAWPKSVSAQPGSMRRYFGNISCTCARICQFAPKSGLHHIVVRRGLHFIAILRWATPIAPTPNRGNAPLPHGLDLGLVTRRHAIQATSQDAKPSWVRQTTRRLVRELTRV